MNMLMLIIQQLCDLYIQLIIGLFLRQKCFQLSFLLRCSVYLIISRMQFLSHSILHFYIEISNSVDITDFSVSNCIISHFLKSSPLLINHTS